MLKRGCEQDLPVQFKGLDWSDVSSIDFVFKQVRDVDAESIKTYKYTHSGSAPTNDIINVNFSVADTYKFQGDRNFYMDTHIHMSEAQSPITIITPIYMYETLFAQEVSSNG